MCFIRLLLCSKKHLKIFFNFFYFRPHVSIVNFSWCFLLFFLFFCAYTQCTIRACVRILMNETFRTDDRTDCVRVSVYARRRQYLFESSCTLRADDKLFDAELLGKCSFIFVHYFPVLISEPSQADRFSLANKLYFK